MAPKPGPPASDFWRRRRARIPNTPLPTQVWPPLTLRWLSTWKATSANWWPRPGLPVGALQLDPASVEAPRIASRVELFVRPRLDQRGARFQACAGAQSERCPRAPRVCYCARNARQVRCCYRAHPCRAGLGSPLFRDRQRSLIRLGMRRPLRGIDRFRGRRCTTTPRSCTPTFHWGSI